MLGCWTSSDTRNVFFFTGSSCCLNAALATSPAADIWLFDEVVAAIRR
jgi:hypothetical protein